MNPRVTPHMNPQEELTDALRWQLRTLRRDESPQRDLWPAIAARLQVQRVTQAMRPNRRWLASVAAAASLVLAIGAVGLWQRSTSAPADTLVQREADGMARQYQAALQEFAPRQAPAPLQPTLDELDRDVALIRDALAHDPDSRLLLEQLRRTYAHRLALAQRVAQGLA